MIIMVVVACNGGSREINGVVKNPEDLLDELQLLQLFAPPAPTNTLEYDCGIYLYLSDSVNDIETTLFSEGLIFIKDEDGTLTAPISVFENFESRETVYLNADDDEILRLAPPYDYNPFWVIEACYPEFNPPEYMLDLLDASRVIMKVDLSPLVVESSSEGEAPISSFENAVKTQSDNLEDVASVSTVSEPRLVVDSKGGDSVLSAVTNTISNVAADLRMSLNIYVDVKNGSDDWNGKAKVAETQNGPKRSIREGLRVVDKNCRVIVAEGCYCEEISVRGKMFGFASLVMFFFGKVARSEREVNNMSMLKISIAGLFMFVLADVIHSGTVTADKIETGELMVGEIGLYNPDNNGSLYFSFSQNEGAFVIDESGNGYDATMSGCVWVNSGLYPGCVYFDGYNDYIYAVPHLMFLPGVAIRSVFGFCIMGVAISAPVTDIK